MGLGAVWKHMAPSFLPDGMRNGGIQMGIYVAVVYVVDAYPNDRSEWYVGAFDSREKAESAAEAWLGYLIYADGYTSKELNYRFDYYTLNKNNFQKELDDYKEEK